MPNHTDRSLAPLYASHRYIEDDYPFGVRLVIVAGHQSLIGFLFKGLFWPEQLTGRNAYAHIGHLNSWWRARLSIAIASEFCQI